MRAGSLFSGIGGFDLAAERVGWQVAWQSEIDPYACRVLAKNFPGVPNLGDITTLDGRKAPPVDLLCGGFPCQDISLAGKGAGLTGARSGLWKHFERLIEEIAPDWVVVENVSALRSRGLDTVLGTLNALGYDAEWHCLPAASVGAPHRRDRIWIVAHSRDTAHALSDELWQQPGRSRGARGESAPVAGNDGQAPPVADAASESQSEPRHETQAECDSGNARLEFGGSRYRRILPHAARELANADLARLQGRISRELQECSGEWTTRTGSPFAGTPDCADTWRQPESQFCRMANGLPARLDSHGGWMSEWEGIPRVATGVRNRVGRLKCLGNAIVPQVAEVLFRAIRQAEYANAFTRET